jgi:hypothetical protein
MQARRAVTVLAIAVSGVLAFGGSGALAAKHHGHAMKHGHSMKHHGHAMHHDGAMH